VCLAAVKEDDMSSHSDSGAVPSARIPANIDKPDVILGRLTARQLAILTATAAILAAGYGLAQPFLPLTVIAAILLPVAAAGAALALGQRDGVSLDRYALAALTHLRRPKHLVAAPEGVPDAPVWCRARGRLPAPLHLPVRAIRADGVMELAGGGTAAIVAASTISFSLRTPAEQTALTAAFARLLNSLEAPVQILVRARPLDFTDLIDELRAHARSLPHSALEKAARAHADHLADLGSYRDLLYRQVLLVTGTAPSTRPETPGRAGQSTGSTSRAGRWWRGLLPGHQRAQSRQAGAQVTLRRAEHLERGLAGLGIGARLLDADQAAAVLADCLDPANPYPATDPGQHTTGRPVTAAHPVPFTDNTTDAEDPTTNPTSPADPANPTGPTGSAHPSRSARDIDKTAGISEAGEAIEETHR
jgi:hypothetical protein